MNPRAIRLATCSDSTPYDATIATHFIGGEYLSRSHAGDPGATAPLTPTPIAEERKAWAQLDRYVFSDLGLEFLRTNAEQS